MEFYHWAHPYDAANRRRKHTAFPRSLAELQNDPYRSLAARVQDAGGRLDRDQQRLAVGAQHALDRQ